MTRSTRILFLDEPTGGGDVELRKDMWEVVAKLRQSGVTVILTTHYIEEAEALARRQEALKKLEELKKSPVAKTAEAVVTKKSIGTLGGAAIGATLGGSLGIAGKFLGAMVFINGAWVLAPVGLSLIHI